MPAKAAQRQVISEALQLAVGFHRDRVFAEAEKLYLGILEIEPACFDALHLLGVLRQQQGRDAEGLSLVERALALDPRSIRALANRATILIGLGRHHEALQAIEQVLARDPQQVDAQCNRGMLCLTLGNFRDGWPGYEWRYRKPDFVSQQRNFPVPQWRGDVPLEGKTILLHAEQGYGDAIQFIRFAPLVAAQGARVVVEADASLGALFARVDGVASFVPRGSALPPFDLHCPLLSLPLAFRTELATIPASVPYLAASPARTAQWRERLGPAACRVGLVWAGKPTHHNDRNRSIALRQLEPLLGAPGIEFISLQREAGETDHAWLAQRGVRALGGELGDFDDTAALVSALDLVITVDTAVAHLAGALAKPVWILLPTAVDWRWMLEREDSPWYPTARLWRQPAAGDWNSVVARMRAALAAPF